MFVPCDEKGNVLEEPESLKGYYETDSDGMKQEAILLRKYQQAKERCLFEGYFTEYDLEEIFKNNTIEDLVKYNL